MTKCTQQPPHHVYVATTPGEPGAHAVCIDQAGYEEHLIEFMAEEVRAGSKIQRVTCDEGHWMLRAYYEWCDAQRSPA